jgi:hypothetical protein
MVTRLQAGEPVLTIFYRCHCSAGRHASVSIVTMASLLQAGVPVLHILLLTGVTVQQVGMPLSLLQ